MEDEDEVLVALAEELGNFEGYVGGPQHAHVVLGALQHLATVEEPLVRQKAWGPFRAFADTRLWNLFKRFVKSSHYSRSKSISSLSSRH
jgi:hypothetical protein